MQWLDKVDDALDWVLGPVESTDGDDANDNAGTGASDGNSNVVGSATAVARSAAGDGCTVVVGKAERQASDMGSSEPSTVQHEIDAGHDTVEGERHNYENITANAPTKTKPLLPLPPPPPPHVKSVTSPPKKREKSPILPLSSPGSSTRVSQQQNQLLKKNQPLPPHPQSAPNSNNNSVLSHPHTRVPRLATRARPRPTPGVIRRKLREPSPSPPESPEPSSSDGTGTSKRNKQISIPLPPFIPSCISIENDKDEVIPGLKIPPTPSISLSESGRPLSDTDSTAKKDGSISIPHPPPPPPPPDTDTSKYNNQSSVSLERDCDNGAVPATLKLPNVSSTFGIGDSVIKIADSDNVKIAKGSVTDSKYKTPIDSVPPPPFSPITPVTDSCMMSKQPSTISIQPAILPPMNEVVDKALDLILGPVQMTDESNNHDSNAEDETEGDKTDDGTPIKNMQHAALAPMNQVEKALDWVLGPVKVQAPAPDGNNTDVDAGDDSKIASKDNGEPISDTITDWFKRIGSTEEGDPKVAKGNADDGSSSDSFNSQVSNDSELTDSDEMDVFALPSPTFSQVQDDQSWDPSLNRYGFFHVRLLRAQRLPCAPGSSINATLSLQPWKGRILIPAHVTIDGPEGAGVCLRWDKSSRLKRTNKVAARSKSSGSKDAESPEDPFSQSMVHAYNNIDTPVPTISLELSISSLGASLGGVFDRFLCSASVPCHDLLRNPRNWTHKWCPANVRGDQIDEEGSSDAKTLPLILLEACFEPKVTRFTVSTLSNKTNQVIFDEEPDDDDQDPDVSKDSDTLGSISHIIHPDRRLGTRPDTVCSPVDEKTSKLSTLTPALDPCNPITKSHLLRVRFFWTPTWCAVCFKNITTTGWLQGKNFECEACHIFSCRDCQLQLDARIPCGSELATIAVKKAQQYQVPSLSRIMTLLAPQFDISNAMGRMPGVGDEVNSPIAQTGKRSNQNMLQHVDGIGIMYIRVLRATIFDKTFPSEAEPNEIFKLDSNLRTGDHYVRVSWILSKESKRTKTVLQSSKPFFDSEEMVFDVPHYGMEYKLEVVDANTDKPIGSCLLSAQGLLQWQRDGMLAKKDRLLLSFFHLRRYSEPRRVKLELRTGVKDGFGLNFYNSSKVAGGPKGKDTLRPGEISGWLECDVRLEEDSQLFYSPKPRQCPQRADEEFDIALIQLHIARIGEIIEAIKKLVSTYNYVVSWESPQITGASMIVYVVLILRYNLEYFGAFPIGSLVLYMIYLAYLRVNGNFKDRWTLKEKKLLIKSEKKIESNQSIFRPVGLLQVADLQGKHLRSRELGLPGSFYTSVSYDPLRYADENMKSSLVKIDTSSGCTHEVGATVSPGITSNPTWTHVQESPELMRLKHLLPDDRLWRQEKEVEASLAYPILQPITENGDYIHEEVGGSQRKSGVQLMPFESSFGAIVLQVRFSDVLGSFQMFDNVLGEVVIPLAKLAGSGRTVEGWFRLLDVGTKDTVPGESPHDPKAMGEGSDTEGDMIPAADFPELYLRVKFSSDGILFNDTFQSDAESSKVICEELSRTASMAQENSGVGVIGSSLNTINTVRTLGGKLQNQISFVVDMLERVRNAFNFSNPRITVFILLSLTLLWMVLALIPTRIVTLFAGLAQFGATFYTKFWSPHTIKTLHKEVSEERLESATEGNSIENLFLSIPTDEDLRRTYFWEARRVGEREREKFAIAKRQTRLEKLWKAKWHGAIGLKEKRSEQATSPFSSRSWSWEATFGLIEGHRFIWWKSEKHFDTGEAPLGQIFFAGHSGLAGLSPLDLRELSKEEVPFVVSIFGRGLLGQQKVTLLSSSSDMKDSLENAVLAASIKAD